MKKRKDFKEGYGKNYMTKRGLDKGDLFIIIIALILLIWAALKSLNVIHSPTWVNMIPYFSIGIVIIGGVYNLGKIKKGIETTEEKVDKILAIENRFNMVEHEHKLAMDGKLKIH